MNDRVTLRDVAREAGVHASTASRALNPETRGVVSETTVHRVLEAARRLSYRPHAVARGLRTNRTMTVGMVVPDLENPLFPPIVRGVEAELGGAGYSILVGNTDNDAERLRTMVASLLAHQVDGLILATAAAHDDLVDELVERRVALVLVNRFAEDVPTSAVVGDDRAGIELAVAHIASLGHRVVGHVAGPGVLSTGRVRAKTFLEAAIRHRLDVDPGLVEEAGWFQVEPGRHACLALLDRRPDMTAVVAANDLLALGCYAAAAQRGRHVPQDLSVTGYNDMPFVDLMEPALTTICVPYREMGHVAGVSLLELMRRNPDLPSPPAETIRLTPSLTVRASTAPPRS